MRTWSTEAPVSHEFPLMHPFCPLKVIIDASGDAHTWARWGRTGTAGQSQVWKAKDEAKAVSIFTDKYKEKTGGGRAVCSSLAAG
jgi:predicted DNA-binding WGR domain protein